MGIGSEPEKTMAELRRRIDALGEISGAHGHHPSISEKVDQIEREIAQRLRVEEALRESERRLFTLMSNLPGMAYRCHNDRDWTMQFVSQGCYGLTGYRSEELTENRLLSFNDLIHPDDQAYIFEQVNLGIARKMPFQLVYRIRAKDGTEKWVWEQGVGVYASMDEPDFLEGFIADITPLKNAESERENLLHGMEERLKELNCIHRVLQSISAPDTPEAVFNHVASFIPGGWRYPEITRSKITIGNKVFVSGSFDETPWRQVCDIVANGKIQGSVEVYYLEERPELFEGPFTLEERQMIGSIANVLARFIERQQADLELRHSEERFRSLVEATSDWIWEVDTKGNFTYVSPRVKAILGYEPEEILGKTPFDLMPAEEAERARSMFSDLLERRAPIEHLENINRHRDGRLVTLETHGLPVFDGEGTFLGYRGIDRDITERKRAENERHALDLKVQHTQKLESLGVLAGGIAHDFNNMLLAILGNADLARVKIEHDASAQMNLEAIVKTAGHAADLCKQMLAYSGKGKFVIESLDLSRLIAEMTRMLEVSISKKVVLKYDFDPQLPAIDADASQLRQVAMNLITNASEAIGEAGGEITVRTGVMHCDAGFLKESYLDEQLPAGDYVFLEVSDTGCGMDTDTQARLFDPFFTTKSTGRGLGLSAVLGIVRSHHGAIKVYSEFGRGTLFKVLIPAISSEAGQHQPVPEISDMPDVMQGTILLVDDEAAVREVVGRMLEKIGFSVMMAVDGREGVDVFRAHMAEIDCVLLDLTMPRMNGEEALLEIRRLRPDCRVLMSSGFSEQEISRNFTSEGHLWFIQKPYQVDALRQKLHDILIGSVI